MYLLSVLIRRLHTVGVVPREFVKIADVKVPIHESKSPHLVPAGFVDLSQPSVVVQTLKWMLQKDLLKQDMFLIGVPGFVRLSVVFEFLELCNREFEYLSITRDTTEADIKQRREIKAGNAFYTDLCAVNAALNGRVLIVDGVEKAERNVLPILNNLLENREMQLDDGRFLMAADKFDKLLEKYSREQLGEWGLERVSEHFSVIALGLPVGFQGHSLDPPLRSRFQCRSLPMLPYETMLSLCQLIAPNVAPSRIGNFLSLVYGLNSLQPEFQVSTATAGSDTKRSKDSTTTARIGEMPIFPVDNARKAVQIWNQCPNYSEEFVFGLCYPQAMLWTDSQRPILNDFLAKFAVERETRVSARIVNVEPMEEQTNIATARVSFGGDSHNFKVPFGGRISPSPVGLMEYFVSSSANERLLVDLLLSHSQTDICLLGPKGSGKSTIVREFAQRLQYSTETIVLYQDMSNRELTQKRRMLENGDTVWEDSQLVTAAKEGQLCILDGIDRIHWSLGEILAPLIHHRFLQLPDGSRLIGPFGYELLKQRTGLSDGDLKDRKVHRISENFRLIALGDSESAPKWLNEQMLAMFVYHSLQPMSIEEKMAIIAKHVPNVCRKTANKLLQFVDKLAHSTDASVRAIATSLSLRRIMHILRRHSVYPEEGIYDATQRAALVRFLPPIVKKSFESSLSALGIHPPPPDHQIIPRAEDNWAERLQKQLLLPDGKGGGKSKRSLADETMVPNIVFFDNVQHLRAISDMARDFELGSHLLLIGNQGVGKNKVTDRFLQQINRPRKYMQLHRDSTIQSLTVQSCVVEGVLKYEDSPLVQAVREGLVLVIDEGDKAPLHVVSILKSLLDSETLYLADGRRICDTTDRGKEDGKTIYVHKNFRIIMLANRPGFPFLGNDLYGLLGDLFAVHYLDNPSKASELAMLAQYGPAVPKTTLELLVNIFGELRSMADQSVLSYPYSTRELVNIVRHLQHFPKDTIQQAVRNVFDFDSFSPDTAETIQEVFTRSGIPLSIGAVSQSFGDAAAYNNWSRIFGLGAGQADERIEIERDGSVFDLSKLGDPKFGKIDPTNAPHIGGNTWAGGVGGYNTAGLGGVGGPFRLDAGNDVHQLPESAKAQVPDHVIKKAREVAKREYAKRLKEIEMSEYDADAYNQLAQRVSRQVKTLKAIIESLESKQHERQWAKHQTSGDLDDAKLIEGVTGEKNIYRKRLDQPDPSTAPKPKRIRLCFDVSGSMYRFNGYDNRLQRSLESALLVMEALDKTDKIRYDIVGHSGESPEIPFVDVDTPPKNEKERLEVLKKMLLHSQFCVSGDNTVEAMETAIECLKNETGDFDERFVVLISDANLDRYGIRPSHLRKALTSDEVNAFVVLIGSLGPHQAVNLQKALPAEKSFVASDATQIPEIMQKIFSATIIK